MNFPSFWRWVSENTQTIAILATLMGAVLAWGLAFPKLKPYSLILSVLFFSVAVLSYYNSTKPPGSTDTSGHADCGVIIKQCAQENSAKSSAALQSCSLAVKCDAKNVRAWLALGQSQKNAGNFAGAVSAFGAVRRLAIEVGDKNWQAQANNWEADVELERGYLDRAESLVANSVALLEGGADRRGLGNSLRMLSFVQSLKSKDSLALINARRSIDICSEVGDRKCMAHNHRISAQIYGRMGNFLQMCSSYRLARSMYSELGEEASKGSVDSMLVKSRC